MEALGGGGCFSSAKYPCRYMCQIVPDYNTALNTDFNCSACPADSFCPVYNLK